MNAIIPYSDLENMAQQVVDSRLFPVKSKAEAMTLFLLCQAEGLHPMRALRMFDIIQGRPAIKPKALMASLTERGGRVEWIQNDDQACIGKFYGKACPEGVVVKFDVEDAKRAGLLNKPGPWQQYRADMLRHRCTGRGVDMADPAAAFGLYSTPVVQDFDDPKSVPAEAEIVDGGKARAEVVGGIGPPTAPPPSSSIESASNPGTTEEWLAEARNRSKEALGKYAVGAESISGAATGVASSAPAPVAPTTTDGDPGPQEPPADFVAAMNAQREEANKRHGRPKDVPDFCSCGEPVMKNESRDAPGIEYWECAYRHSERSKMKEQGMTKAQITKNLPPGHVFQYDGKVAK